MSINGRHSVQVVGDVTGQIAVGENILQIGPVYGGVVNVAMPGQRPQLEPRSTPVSILPRPYPGLLDREVERRRAVEAATRGDQTDIYGPEGSGKTSILRSFAHDCSRLSLADGVVFLDARGMEAGDLQQSIVESFYTCDQPYKVSAVDAKTRMGDKRALIVLDDVELSREDVQRLLNIAPMCAFVYSSQERVLWGDGDAIEVRGLPGAESVQLFERELGRRLNDGELQFAETVCDSLEGHPLRILQAAAEARKRKITLDALTTSVVVSPSDIDERKRRILAFLAIFVGSGLRADHVRAMTQDADSDVLLDELVGQKLAREEDGMYRVAVQLTKAKATPEQVSASIDHFVDWSQSHAVNQGEMLRNAGAIQRVIDLAAEERRWQDVAALAHSIEGPLALSGRWDSWKRALLRGSEAAQATDDRSGLARWQHQLGTMFLCLGDLGQAKQRLSDALSLRKSLGEVAAASVTQHNLDLLSPPVSGRATRAKAGLGKLVGFVIVGLLVLGFVAFSYWPRPSNPGGDERELITVAIEEVRALSAHELEVRWSMVGASSSGLTVTRWETEDPGTRENLQISEGKPSYLDSGLMADTEYTYEITVSTMNAKYTDQRTGRTLREPFADVEWGTVSLSETTVEAGSVTGGIVTMSGLSAERRRIRLTSSSPAVTMQNEVVIEPNESTSNFEVSTNSDMPAQSVTITASFGNVDRSATLRITSAPTAAVTLLPLILDTKSVKPSGTAKGTVRLSGPARAGGAEVTLSVESGPVTVSPDNVTIPEGQAEIGFVVTALGSVTKETVATVTATYNGARVDATLRITPDPVYLLPLILDTKSVKPGGTAKGTVRLSVPARAGGAKVTLSGDSRYVTVSPRSITIPEGQAEIGFLVTALGSVTPEPGAMVSAVLNGKKVTETLMITRASPPYPTRKPELRSIDLEPTSIKPGESATCTVTLTSAALGIGANVTIWAEPDRYVTLRKTRTTERLTSLKIVSGQTFGKFDVYANKIGLEGTEDENGWLLQRPTTVTIHAEYAGTDGTAKLTIGTFEGSPLTSPTATHWTDSSLVLSNALRLHASRLGACVSNPMFTVNATVRRRRPRLAHTNRG